MAAAKTVVSGRQGRGAGAARYKAQARVVGKHQERLTAPTCVGFGTLIKEMIGSQATAGDL